MGPPLAEPRTEGVLDVPIEARDPGLTFPADNPIKRIDYAFFSSEAGIRGLVPRDVRTVGTVAVPWPASDHLGLLVDLELVEV